MANYVSKDETGKKYGRLLVLYAVETRARSNGCIRYMCRCDCGEYRTISGDSLRLGRSRSCGCLRRKNYGIV